MQGSMPRLTHNGVLYLSLGFSQDYLLQVLTLNRHHAELQLVLYDGLAYIGALLPSSSSSPPAEQQVQEYDVVRVVPLLARPNQPIVIHRLEVVQHGLNCLLGEEVITLEEFMHRRQFARKSLPPKEEIEELSPHSRKIAKLIDQSSEKPTDETGFRVENIPAFNLTERLEALVSEEQQEQRQPQEEPQNMVIEQPVQEEPRVEEEIHRETTSVEPSPEPQLENNQQPAPPQQNQPKPLEQNHIIDLDIDEEPFATTSNQQPNSHQKANSNPTPVTTIPNSRPTEMHTASVSATRKQTRTSKDETMRIKDLYERMHRFRLLCRVNHISQFVTQAGKCCSKLHLIDELGEEMPCVLRWKAQPIKNAILKGKAYIFQEGEVCKNEDGLVLEIGETGFIDQHRFMPSFVPAKMMRIGQLQQSESSGYYLEKAINLDRPAAKKPQQPFNVCGIFQGFKDTPKSTKNYFRVTGVLCDPGLELSIHFGLLVDELCSFPKEGAAVSLHNMLLVQDEHTMQLEGSRQGYILDQAGNAHEYFADLLKSSRQGDWRLHEYRNLSLVTYVARTVAQLYLLLTRVGDQELAYSEIDCRISSVCERRAYEACLVCRREVKAESGLFAYCFHCRKHSKHAPRFLFDMEVSDATGCLMADLPSDNLQDFLGMTAEQYCEHSREDRGYFLELCAFKAVVVRLRSERTAGSVKHKAVSATQANHKRSLNQIRNIAIEEKTKYVSSWRGT